MIDILAVQRQMNKISQPAAVLVSTQMLEKHPELAQVIKERQAAMAAAAAEKKAQADHEAASTISFKGRSVGFMLMPAGQNWDAPKVDHVQHQTDIPFVMPKVADLGMQLGVYY